jgi:hypothetical protein
LIAGQAVSAADDQRYSEGAAGQLPAAFVLANASMPRVNSVQRSIAESILTR